MNLFKKITSFFSKDEIPVIENLTIESVVEVKEKNTNKLKTTVMNTNKTEERNELRTKHGEQLQNLDLIKPMIRELSLYTHRDTKEFWDNLTKFIGYLSPKCYGVDLEMIIDQLLVKKQYFEDISYDENVSVEEAREAVINLIAPVKKQLTCAQKHRLADLALAIPELTDVFQSFACKNAHKHLVAKEN